MSEDLGKVDELVNELKKMGKTFLVRDCALNFLFFKLLNAFTDKCSNYFYKKKPGITLTFHAQTNQETIVSITSEIV